MPLSVDELLAQRGPGGARPRFVSRKERERHKEEERKAEVDAEAARVQEAKRARAEWERSARSAPPRTRRGESKRSESETPCDDLSAAVAASEDAALAEYRQRYLGQRASSTRTARHGNSKRFRFDWDEADDTSDPLQAPLTSTQGVLGGRGGLDASERSAGTGRGALRSTLAEKPWTEKALEEMRERDWRIFREDYAIAVRGGDIPPPLRSWRESQIPARVLDAIDAVGYKEPTAIQRQAIPVGLRQRDLIGLAETGSGKTASFVVPMLSYVLSQPPMTGDVRLLGPYGLILVPTRELAQQIEAEARRLAEPLGISVVSLVGGRDIAEQAFMLGDGAEMVIATPGRLQDCLERRMLVLGQCRYLVLDEADRMVDMNYEEALHAIFAELPTSAEGRVTMLYSATMPPSVERIARTYLRAPATVTVGAAGRAVGTVEQRVEFVANEEQRKRRLLAVLDSGFAPPMIVFVNQKGNADVVGRELRRAGWYVAVLHSGLSQPQREAAIGSLRDGSNEVLCCTDIGARGIDLPDVSLVVNYQFPTQFPSYIHRIGRTGRAGKQGCAVSFVDDDDAAHFWELRQELGKSPVSAVPAELAQHPAAQRRT